MPVVPSCCPFVALSEVAYRDCSFANPVRLCCASSAGCWRERDDRKRSAASRSIRQHDQAGHIHSSRRGMSPHGAGRTEGLQYSSGTTRPSDNCDFSMAHTRRGHRTEETISATISLIRFRLQRNRFGQRQQRIGIMRPWADNINGLLQVDLEWSDHPVRPERKLLRPWLVASSS